MRKERVLLIEDNDNDARFVLEGLQQRPSQYSCTRVVELKEAFAYIASHEVDVALLDLTLPDAFGLATFEKFAEANPRLPVVILTGVEDEQLALNAVRAGAQDYICKSDLNYALLFRSIQYAIERKQIYEFARLTLGQLQETMTALNLSAKASNTGLWFVDLDTHKVTWNEQTTSLFGLRTRRNPHKLNEVYELIHKDDVAHVAEVVEGAMAKHEEWEVEFRAIWEDETEHRLICHGKTFFDENNQPTRMAGTCRDISKQRQEEAVTRRLALLEQREDFTATLTHDLKNPLIGTNQILELMLNNTLGSINSQQADLLAQIKNSNTHLLNLIQNLTEVYRFEHQTSTYFKHMIDIIPIINSCITEIGILAKSKNVSVSIETPHKEWIINADGLAFRRVIQNLLDNAIKFSSDGGTVTVRLCGNAHMTVIEVQDYGFGISPKDQPNLFQRFVQGRTGRKHSTGTGLGLYLCKQIIEAHNGEISCESVLGVGTTFKIVLPTIEDSLQKQFGPPDHETRSMHSTQPMNN